MKEVMRDGSTIELLERYDRPGPRYTSYPTALEFHNGVGNDIYGQKLAKADEATSEPLSFYAHLPFCEARCSFCGCNVIITKHRDVAAEYLAYLEKEIDLLASHLPHRRAISQMHWGGGTPTYYEAGQLDHVFDRIAKHFTFTPDAEIGVEIDPRVTRPEHLETLRRVGFNRLSMGVQDFTRQVQEGVNRIQSYEQTAALIEQSRALGFESVNVDLIYGLPFQTVDSFARTLEQVLTLRPDRVAVYSFAFVPWMKAHMNQLSQEALPAPRVKLELLAQTIDAFLGAGYRQIGMDHFALPTDELAQAVEAKTLHRNFMGYTVQSTADMVALGVSGIGEVRGTFVQNTKKLPEYYGAIDAGRFPIERGYELQDDDLVRRQVITSLMCHGRVVKSDIERQFGIAFDGYFAAELAELAGDQSTATDGLVSLDADAIQVTALGNLFVRNVCMVFDRYLRARLQGPKPVFSRTV